MHIVYDVKISFYLHVKSQMLHILNYIISNMCYSMVSRQLGYVIGVLQLYLSILNVKNKIVFEL
jgi:hypothetical protein